MKTRGEVIFQIRTSWPPPFWMWRLPSTTQTSIIAWFLSFLSFTPPSSDSSYFSLPGFFHFWTWWEDSFWLAHFCCGVCVCVYYGVWCVNLLVGIYTCVLLCLEARNACWVYFLDCFLHLFFEKGLLLSLKLIDLAWLTSQWVSGICLSLPIQQEVTGVHWHIWLSWGLNSDSHT